MCFLLKQVFWGRYCKLFILFVFWANTVSYEQVKVGYCNGSRIGLGSDKTHGKNNPSLEVCAEEAISDTRCDGSGYFDASGSGNSWQCKCTTTNNCVISIQPADDWKIYLASNNLKSWKDKNMKKYLFRKEYESEIL